MAKDGERAPTPAWKLYLRGCVTNGVGSLLLLVVGTQLAVERYVLLAAAVQAAVYLAHGLPQRSEKYYDLSGSLTHFLVVAASLLEPRVRTSRQALAALTSVVWMTRLGTFLFLRISRDGKDGRFDALKPNWLSFAGAWTLQAVWVTFIQLPVVLLNARDDTAPLGVLDGFAALLWAGCFALEALADNEKMTFRNNPANKEKFITTGVWKYSRHPNYCGEIGMWVAHALAASSAAAQTGNLALLGAWISPAFTAVLLLKVSGVPMVEKAGQKKWGDDPAYQHYVEHTSCLVPWTPAPVKKGD